MRAVVYARISRDPDEQRIGVDRQLLRGAEVAERHGWEVVDTFVDNDASGFTDSRREGFDALVKAIEDGDVDAVVVQHQDRIARNVTTFRRFADLCRSRDVRLETWSGPIDTDSAAGRLQSTIQAGVDEHYSALISEKVRAALEAAAVTGQPAPGRRPFGYERGTRDDGSRTLTSHPTEAPRVREMFERVANGASIYGLFRELVDDGVPTAGGGKWAPLRIREILSNPLYLGLRVHRGEVIGEGNWPAITDRDTFDLVQTVLASRRGNTSDGRRRYFLSGGVAVCGLCGHKLVSKRSTTRGGSYICPSTTLGGCGGVGVQQEGLEEYVSELIVQALSDQRIVEAVRARRHTNGNRELLERLDGITDRRTVLAEAFAMGEIDRAQLAAATAKLNDQETDLRSQIVDEHDDLPDVEDLANLFRSEDAEWRRRVAMVLIAQVVVNPAVRGRNFFDPARVEVVWN